MSILAEEQKKTLKQYVEKLNPSLTGLFFYYCLPFRKKVVLSNIQQVFSNTLSDSEMKKLAKAFYSHVAQFLFENIQLRFLSKEQVQERVEVVGHEYLLEAHEQGRGIALLAGHFGNWELSAIGGMLNFQQFRGHFYIIRKTFNIKWLERILFRRFSEAGLMVITKRNALGSAVEAIEEKNVVVFLMDQYARAKDGVRADFFGKPTGTYKSLAMIAQNTQAAVIPMKSFRVSPNRHVLRFYPPMEWVSSGNEKEDILLNTRQYNAKIESFLLSTPDQWLWFHKRWKTE